MQGVVHSKQSSYTKKIRKIRKKSKNSKDFFLWFKICLPYLEVNKSSISVFKSFFIHKIIEHLKNPDKNSKNPKKNKKSEKIYKIYKIRKKFKDYFEDLKSVHPMCEWTTPRSKVIQPEIALRRSLNFTKRKCKGVNLESHFVLLDFYATSHRVQNLNTKSSQVCRMKSLSNSALSARPRKIIKTSTRKISRTRWLTKAIDYGDVTVGAWRERKGEECSSLKRKPHNCRIGPLMNDSRSQPVA